MIIQTGMRTDIPAFYSKWFLNRIREGYVLVCNPYKPSQATKYSLSPDVSSCKESADFQGLSGLNRKDIPIMWVRFPHGTVFKGRRDLQILSRLFPTFILSLDK